MEAKTLDELKALTVDILQVHGDQSQSKLEMSLRGRSQLEVAHALLRSEVQEVLTAAVDDGLITQYKEGEEVRYRILKP